MDETDITDWPSCKLGKKFSNLERSLRCLICRDMYENPQMLNCGHSYCSLCIRQHLDQTLNPNNSKTCPDCKEKSEVCHLKPNLNLASAILAYKELRPDVLNELLSNGDSSSTCGATSTSRRSKKNKDNRDVPIPVSRKLAHMSFHGKTKKYVKDAIDTLCISTKARPAIDGSQSELEGFYRQLVHLNNAQIGSLEPLSFDAVVKESIKKYESIRKEARSNGASKGCAENMKKGVISDSANSGFRLLIRQANAAKRKFAESSSSSHSDSTEAILASQDLEPEPGEYTDGDWRIIMSDKLSRPFFFNTKTGVGSFAVPKEIAETTDAAELGAVSASQEGEVCISLCESANNGKRKRSTSIDIVSHDDHALSQTVNKSGSSGGSFEIPNAIKIDDTGTAAAVRNLIFVTEGETPVVAKSFDRSNHVVSDIKKSQGTPTIEILDDDDDDDDDNKDEDKDGDNNVKKIEKGTERLHAPDLIENGDQNTINVHNLDKHGIVESAYQSTDSTQLDITQSNEKISNGSSSKNNQIESNISWSCSQCTFENKSSAFTCCMCGMHSGRQRRSLRESQNTIMQGFALTQSQQTNYSTDVFPGSWR